MPHDSLPVLVTGAAGFIGYHVADRLLRDGHTVVGLDNLSDYYDPQLKRDRLAELEPHGAFEFVEMDVADLDGVRDLFGAHGFGRVVHLAAQAGVRYSLENPAAYVFSNQVGFLSIVEGCRQVGAEHLVYASSSSVYGANGRVPFSVHHGIDHPVSLYAATKASNELVAHAYSKLYGLPTTGLRFFTVYGPWGRPDMAIFKFARAIVEGDPIDIYNHGDMKRDFTYVDDIVEGVVRVLDRPAQPDLSWSAEAPDPATSGVAPYRVYNIGNGQPVDLLEFVSVLEEELGTPARKNLLPMQPGDVPLTFADTTELYQDTGFEPNTPLREGVRRFVAWYQAYYGVPSFGATP